MRPTLPAHHILIRMSSFFVVVQVTLVRSMRDPSCCGWRRYTRHDDDTNEKRKGTSWARQWLALSRSIPPVCVSLRIPDLATTIGSASEARGRALAATVQYCSQTKLTDWRSIGPDSICALWIGGSNSGDSDMAGRIWITFTFTHTRKRARAPKRNSSN